ncbi:LemA family protein [Cohnella nanjingensis]|uniref:LemA family protein n=1 Tax=Cohnella nanjingensis TaxID=1387779 RepID=A0A7X0RSL9_9BACL|nr:LemA family protein [Cohnella nanjingensis]MBB6672917.1 LemA family protein [Cohnella nanjingensis]
MVGYIVLGIVVILLLWLILTYNRLILLKNRVRNNWSQVDVVLKNRFDLIPNLIETVKGYAAHEKEAFTRVSELRTQYAAAGSVEDKAAVSGEISGLMSRLLMVAESYPELKANENFLYLKQQLSAIEDKIRFARQFYNDTVEAYNTAIMSFPANLLAGLFNFKQERFFQIDEAEKSGPQVKF